jgi:hypothetical protein
MDTREAAELEILITSTYTSLPSLVRLIYDILNRTAVPTPLYICCGASFYEADYFFAIVIFLLVVQQIFVHYINYRCPHCSRTRTRTFLSFKLRPFASWPLLICVILWREARLRQQLRDLKTKMFNHFLVKRQQVSPWDLKSRRVSKSPLSVVISFEIRYHF